MMNERRNTYKSKGSLWVYVDFIFGEIGHLFGYNYFVAVFHLMRFESAIQVLFVASNFSEILTENPYMFSNRKDNTFAYIRNYK